MDQATTKSTPHVTMVSWLTSPADWAIESVQGDNSTSNNFIVQFDKLASTKLYERDFVLTHCFLFCFSLLFIVITRCPSSFRPSVTVNFSHYRLLLKTAYWNSTKLNRKQGLNVLYQVCVFRTDWKNKMAILDSNWLRHFLLLLWNRLTVFNETWQGARSQPPIPSLCFSGLIGKPRWPPWPQIGWDL